MNQEQQEWLNELLAFREDELTEKQAKIVQAAIEIFSEKGFAATSTSEIAKRAGVAEGTIFRHYKTKKDLLLSIVFPVLSKIVVPFFADKFIKEVFQVEKLHDMEQLLRNLIRNRFEFMKQNVPLIKIVLQEMAYHDEIQENFKKVFTEKVYPRFVEAVRHVRKQGDLVDFPDETIIRLTMSTILGFLITRFIVMPDFPWDDEKEIDYTIRFIINGLKDI